MISKPCAALEIEASVLKLGALVFVNELIFAIRLLPTKITELSLIVTVAKALKTGISFTVCCTTTCCKPVF